MELPKTTGKGRLIVWWRYLHYHPVIDPGQAPIITRWGGDNCLEQLNRLILDTATLPRPTTAEEDDQGEEHAPLRGVAMLGWVIHYKASLRLLAGVDCETPNGLAFSCRKRAA